MSLFAKLPEKEEEKSSLFTEKNNEESGEKIDGIDGAGEIGNGTESGTESGTDGGIGIAGTDIGTDGTGGRNEIGFVQLSFTDSDFDGTDSDFAKSDDSDSTSDNGTGGLHSQTSNKSSAKTNNNSRPSFLNFGAKKEEDEDKPKDIKIKKSGRGKNKKNGMEEEQVEILLVSLFDGFALFRGEHWKIKEDEKHIIPALTRILNRMLEALPKGVSENAFNIMDYVIVIGAISAMIISRLKFDKGAEKIGKSEGIKIGATADSLSTGNENDSERFNAEPVRPSEPHERTENGYSSFTPIKDIAGSVSRIS